MANHPGWRGHANDHHFPPLPPGQPVPSPAHRHAARARVLQASKIAAGIPERAAKHWQESLFARGSPGVDPPGMHDHGPGHSDTRSRPAFVGWPAPHWQPTAPPQDIHMGATRPQPKPMPRPANASQSASIRVMCVGPQCWRSLSLSACSHPQGRCCKQGSVAVAHSTTSNATEELKKGGPCTSTSLRNLNRGNARVFRRSLHGLTPGHRSHAPAAARSQKSPSSAGSPSAIRSSTRTGVTQENPFKQTDKCHQALSCLTKSQPPGIWWWWFKKISSPASLRSLILAQGGCQLHPGCSGGRGTTSRCLPCNSIICMYVYIYIYM